MSRQLIAESPKVSECCTISVEAISIKQLPFVWLSARNQLTSINDIISYGSLLESFQSEPFGMNRDQARQHCNALPKSNRNRTPEPSCLRLSLGRIRSCSYTDTCLDVNHLSAYIRLGWSSSGNCYYLNFLLDCWGIRCMSHMWHLSEKGATVRTKRAAF